MSTTTLKFNPAKMLVRGSYERNFASYPNELRLWFGSYIEFEVTGVTDVSVNLGTYNAGQLELTVNGVVTTPTMDTGGTSKSVSLLGGLGVEATTYTIRLRNVNNTNWIWLYDSPWMTLTYTTGPAQLLTPADLYQFSPVNERTVLGEGYFCLNPNNGSPYQVLGAFNNGLNDNGVHFRATTDTISSFNLRNGAGLLLYVDGTLTHTASIYNDSSYGMDTLFSGLDATAEHEYWICHRNDTGYTAGTPAAWQTAGIQVKQFSAADLAHRPVVVFLGDSIGTQICTQGTWISKFCALTGRAPISLCTGGATIYTSPNSANCLSSQVASLGTAGAFTGYYPSKPQTYVILMGTNDATYNNSSTNVMNALLSNLQTLFAQNTSSLASGGVQPQIYVIGPLVRSDQATCNAALPNIRAAMLAACNSAQHYDVTYIDPSNTNNWFNPNDTRQSSGGLHPIDYGNTVIAAAVAAALPPVSPPPITVLAPNQLLFGQTMSLPNGSTRTGTLNASNLNTALANGQPDLAAASVKLDVIVGDLTGTLAPAAGGAGRFPWLGW